MEQLGSLDCNSNAISVKPSRCAMCIASYRTSTKAQTSVRLRGDWNAFSRAKRHFRCNVHGHSELEHRTQVWNTKINLTLAINHFTLRHLHTHNMHNFSHAQHKMHRLYYVYDHDKNRLELQASPIGNLDLIKLVKLAGQSICTS